MCTPSHFFFFNDTAPTKIYTLSLHPALPFLRMLAHVPGTPPLSGARHSSARCSPEPPLSELESRLEKVPPVEVLLGFTSNALKVGAVVSGAVTVTLMAAGSFL